MLQIIDENTRSGKFWDRAVQSEQQGSQNDASWRVWDV